MLKTVGHRIVRRRLLSAAVAGRTGICASTPVPPAGSAFGSASALSTHHHSFAISNSRPMASFASPTSPLLDQVEINVPTMGDSITEGTIVEWVAQVGQYVKDGDVVALVETDKVTVDIKAERDGVVVEHFGEVDDTVEVGAPLYKIDTEATEPEEGFFEVAGVSGEEEEAAAAASTGTDGGASSADGASGTGRSGGHTRIPSIHFLGKTGWAEKLSAPVRDAAADIAAGVPPAVGGPAPTSVEVVVGPNYGRPPITEREMEALILGGAEEAPKMKAPSGPALFGF